MTLEVAIKVVFDSEADRSSTCCALETQLGTDDPASRRVISCPAISPGHPNLGPDTLILRESICNFLSLSIRRTALAGRAWRARFFSLLRFYGSSTLYSLVLTSRRLGRLRRSPATPQIVRLASSLGFRFFQRRAPQPSRGHALARGAAQDSLRLILTLRSGRYTVSFMARCKRGSGTDDLPAASPPGQGERVGTSAKTQQDLAGLREGSPERSWRKEAQKAPIIRRPIDVVDVMSKAPRRQHRNSERR